MEFILALAKALAKNKLSDVDAFIPRLLSFDTWQIKPLEVVAILEHLRQTKIPFFAFIQDLGSHPNENFDESLTKRLQDFANFYLNLATKVSDFSAEYIINEIIKTQFSGHNNYQLLSHLTTLRELVQSKNQKSKLTLTDFYNLLANYQAFDLQVLDTSPYREADNSIQLLTVHSAKGLEFDYVFLLDCDNKNWSDAKGNTDRLTLPHNLEYVRHTGDSADEKLRVLFVAITRARQELTLASSTSNFSGKTNDRLKYLGEREDEADSGESIVRADKIPAPYDQVQVSSVEEITPEDLSIDWFSPYLPMEIDDPSILKDRVEHFKLTASKAKSFIDLKYSTMTDFIRSYIYGWPSDAPSLQIFYGNIIHDCMEHLHKDQLDDTAILALFEQEALDADLEKDEKEQLLERGKIELAEYLKNRGPALRDPNINVLTEKSLHENIVMNGVELTGKIDRVEINETDKTITVVDFKTGKPKEKWSDSDFTCFGYKLQLYFYKFLIENSYEFKNYKVKAGRIEFLPKNDNDENIALSLTFTNAESEKFQKLFSAIYRHIKTLDFPKTTEYESQSNPTKAFVEALLAED